MTQMPVCWPKVFTDPDFEYDDPTSRLTYRVACADCLMGWANCSLEKPPGIQFGWGMLKIMDITGTTDRDKIYEILDNMKENPGRVLEL